MIPLEELESSSTTLEQPPAAEPRLEAPPSAPHCYRMLVERLKQWGDELDKPSLAIGLSGCGPRQGVSTVATHLAQAAAEMLEAEVVLVDGHRSRPSLDRSLAIPRSPGLGDFLGGMAVLPDCLSNSRLQRLKVMPAGASGTIGDEESSGVETMLSALRRRFGWIVVDLPPAGELSACRPLARQLDGVLLIVAAGCVPRPVACKAVEQLRVAGAHVMGAVLNESSRDLPWWLERRL